MNTIKIYGCYAEGYVCKGSVELTPVEPCSLILDIAKAYASVGIDVNGAKPVVIDFDDEGFASGFEVDGATYVHFKKGHVFNSVLVREA